MAGMRFPTRLGMLIVLFAIPLILVAQTTAQTTTADRVRSITAALRAGQFDAALNLLQPELGQNPGNPQLWALRGIALSGKGDKKEALTAFRKALVISPDYLPALEGAAQIEYENGRKDAVALLQHVLKLRPNDPTSHAMLAVLAYKTRDCANAVLHFEHSGALLESQPGALQDYGGCLMQQGQTGKAIPVFQRILAAHPDDPRARRSLAAVELAAEQPEVAITTLLPLLTASEPDVSTLQLAAAAYEANKDTPKAVKMLHDAIVKDPHNVALYVDFANIAMTHQSFQAGIEMVDSGINLQPKAADLYLARGVLYV